MRLSLKTQKQTKTHKGKHNRLSAVPPAHSTNLKAKISQTHIRQAQNLSRSHSHTRLTGNHEMSA